MPSRTRRTRAVGLLAALALGLAGCGGGVGDAVAGLGEGVAAAIPPATSPLTGLPAEPAGLRRPVLVVKIDNTPASAPQRGLAQADLVVEELVEGGVTRLAAFFQSDLPGGDAAVGPVRSMRASDIGIVAPVDGTLVTSGAAGVTIQRIVRAGLRFRGEGTPGLFRAATRSAPYNLFARLRDVADDLGRDGTRRAVTAPYLPFGVGELPAGEPAAGVTARFSGAHATSWRRVDEGYVADDDLAARGERFVADTVLVLRVEVGDAGYLDPAGNPVPETRLVGAGEALVVHDGRAIRGTWSKSALDAPIALRAGGAPLALPPGRTWIELVPSDGGEVAVDAGN